MLARIQDPVQLPSTIIELQTSASNKIQTSLTKKRHTASTAFICISDCQCTVLSPYICSSTPCQKSGIPYARRQVFVQVTTIDVSTTDAIPIVSVCSDRKHHCTGDRNCFPIWGMISPLSRYITFFTYTQRCKTVSH